MTTPLAILAFFAVALGAIGTPAWPWFRAFLENRAVRVDLHAFAEPAWLMLLLTSLRHRCRWHRPWLVALRQQVA